MDEVTGRMLGDRYELGEVIGRGGMAEVFEARDLRLGRRVAVKVLRADLARDPSFQTRFRREAQAAAGLNHPNIVAVYDTGEDVLDVDGVQTVVPYIVMELVDGTTLRQLLTSGRRLLPERALEITAGVMAALDYAHRHGIVHRDIKPGNVMLTRSGDVKVMDFGIARALNQVGESMTSTSAVMGTAQYLSPEQARGEVVDARSDIYSAGVLLYELLTGRPPFTGDSAVSIAYQHVSEAAAPPSQIDPQIPPEIDALVMRALTKSPDQRYQTSADFRADIERAIVGSPVTAPLPRITADTARLDPYAAVEADEVRAARRGRAGVAIAVAVVVGLLALGGAILLITRLMAGGGAITKVTVPNLDGMTIQKATSVLEGKGLTLGTQTPEVSDKPKDTIIGQQPTAGEQLENGQAVSVTVSVGRERTLAPNLLGLVSIEDARTALADARLQLGAVQQEDSEQPPGYVLGQKYAEGTPLEVGTRVGITVSSGKIQVPQVVGATEAQARSDLANKALVVEVVYQESKGTPGIVLKQVPTSGTPVVKGTLVTLTVSKPKESPSPSPSPTEPTPSPSPSPTDPTPTPEPTVSPAPLRE